jgi:hypothetical protein
MKTVKIYSIHFDRPEFIKWQYDSFKHHLQDNYEYIIINNAFNNSIERQINQEANNLSIQVINSPTSKLSTLAGIHHINAFNYAWNNYAVKDKNYSILMDGDCFLVKSFSVNSFLGNYVLAGPKQRRNYKYHYLTPTIIIANPENIPDANTIDWEGIGVMENNQEIRLDTGGGLYLYYQSHPEVKKLTKEIKSSWHLKKENSNLHCLPDQLINEYNDEYCIEFFGNEFLHYCRSSNWNYQSEQHHKLKSDFVKKFIYGTIDNSIITKNHDFQTHNKEYFGWD